jgi:hypothetical protein
VGGGIWCYIDRKNKKKKQEKKRNLPIFYLSILFVIPFISLFSPHFLIRSLDIAFQRVMKALMEINPSSPPSV